jgi:hypothetical protein
VNKKPPEKTAYRNKKRCTQNGKAKPKNLKPDKIALCYQINRAADKLGNKNLSGVNGNKTNKSKYVLNTVTLEIGKKCFEFSKRDFF